MGIGCRGETRLGTRMRIYNDNVPGQCPSTGQPWWSSNRLSCGLTDAAIFGGAYKFASREEETWKANFTAYAQFRQGHLRWPNPVGDKGNSNEEERLSIWFTRQA